MMLRSLFFLGSFISLNTHAGGIMLYEIASDDIGLASAGYSARAQDPSTVYTNPAGMTRLQGNQLLIGAQLLYQDLELTINNASPFLGSGNGGNPTVPFPGASFFYTHSLSQDLKLGLGIYGNFGASVEYDEGWVGRYYLIKGTLIGFSIQPTIAYKMTDSFSVGIAPVFMCGILKNQTTINNSPFQLIPRPDGELNLSDQTFGYGGNLGLLYEFNPNTRIGFTYTAPITLKFSPAPEFSNISDQLNQILNRRNLDSEIDINIHVPQTIMASLFHQMTQTWAILTSIGWQEWSKFGDVEIGINSINPTTLMLHKNFKNTWHAAFGLQHKMNEHVLWHFGVAYDTRFQDKHNVSMLLPTNSVYRLGVGIKYSRLRSVDLGASFEYMDGSTLNVNSNSAIRGDLSGQFKNPRAYFLSINGTFKMR